MKGKRSIFLAVKWIFALLVTALFAFPLVFLVINSFRDKMDIVDNPLSFSGTLSFENFANAIDRMQYLTSFTNSLIVTVCSAVGIMFFASMLAFFIARFETKLNKAIFYTLVVSMIVPFQAVMIPFVYIYGQLHLLNSMPALMFFYLGFGLSLTTFMYHGFIKRLSVSLEEAASMEGASLFAIFWKVVFPQLIPITSTTFVLNVLWFWNDYLLPSLVLIQKSRTLPLATYTFFGTFTSDYGIAMAGLMLSIIPIIIFYVFMQKNIVGGITDGAVK